MKALLPVVAAALIAAPVSAAPIVGAISFSDGFAATAIPSGHNTSIVSTMTAIDVGDTTLAQGCAGTFATGGTCVPNLGAFAHPFSITDGAQLVYQYSGFNFVANIFGPIVRDALQCDEVRGLCSDSLVFDAVGLVTGLGFDATPMLMSWTGQGTCVEWRGMSPPMCEGANSASWSASVSTMAQPVPAPGTVALIGLGLILVAAVRRVDLP